MDKKKGVIVGIAFGLIALMAGSIWYYSRTTAFMAKVGEIASQEISRAIGAPISIGSVEVTSLHALTVRDLALYDKKSEYIAKVNEAEVEFSLLAALSPNPLDAVKRVELRTVDAVIAQRDDESINVLDLVTEGGGETEFHAEVEVKDGTLHLKRDGKTLTLEDVAATADFADYPAIDVVATARSRAAKLKINGVMSSERQIGQVEVENLEVADYLPLLPEGLLPGEIKVLGARLEKGKVSFLRQYGEISLCGDAKYEGGRVRILDTLVEEIGGTAFFTENDTLLATDLASAGQKVHLNGKVRWDTPEPYLDLKVASDSFAPGKVLPNLPFEGAAEFRATARGVVSNPIVEGDFKVAEGMAEGVYFQNALCHAKMQNNYVNIEKLSANLLGGNIRGEGALNMSDLSFAGRVRPEGIDLSYAKDFLPAADVSGRLSADVGITGRGVNFDELQFFGSVNADNVAYKNLPLELVAASFHGKGRSFTVDYLSARMPNKSSLGLEGKLIDGRELDFKVYGGHVDLSLLSLLEPRVDLTGLADFRGALAGDLTNPRIKLQFSGLRGALFKQPYDSLLASLEGDLESLNIKEFFMEKGGKEVWRVDGQVGLIGEQRLNLEVNTMGARLEDIAALVAPDQKLTGSFDNIIKITGTLPSPKAVGYVHMYRGSYMGMLLSGMDGDYTFDGDIVNLQDFHIFSPMIDMDVNGSIDTKTHAVSMKAVVHDIDAKRFRHKFPYDVSGHGTFNGVIGGTLEAINFDGVLNMPEIMLNGHKVENLKGEVTYRDDVVTVREFGFKQNDGEYSLKVACNLKNKILRGDMQLVDADVGFLLAVANQRNDFLEGTLNSKLVFDEDNGEQIATLKGTLPVGKLAGHDIHDTDLELNLRGDMLSIDHLSGFQGEAGKFTLNGTMNFARDYSDLKLTAENLATGMFTNLAGMDIAAVGLTDISAKMNGAITNPIADITVGITNGGIQGSTFDDLNGVFHVSDGRLEVRNLSVHKEVLGKDYRASAKGFVPWRALVASDDETLTSDEQMHLSLSLDDSDLSLLPLLSPSIEWAQGETDGNVEISGTVKHPSFHGQFAINSGSMKLKPIYTPIEDMRLTLNLDGQNFTLSECSGRMGDGVYSLDGSMSLWGLTPTNYKLKFVADRLNVQSEFFKGPVSADFTLSEQTMNFITGRELRLPLLSGNINLENTLLSLPSLPETEGEMPNIFLDVNLNLGNKVRFYSPYVGNMSFTGSAHFGGTTRYPQPSGTISVARGGTINYMKSAVFKIEEGEIYFNQMGTFLPSIDFHAQTRIGHTKVFLDVTGSLGKDLNFGLTSSPEMSQTEILQLLTLRTDKASGQNISAGDVLAMGLQMSVLSEFEEKFRNMMNLDVLSVSRGSSSLYNRDDENKDTYNLQVGKYISDKVMIRYGQDFGGSSLHRFGVQYDLNDRVSFTLDREGSKFVYGVEAKIKF